MQSSSSFFSILWICLATYSMVQGFVLSAIFLTYKGGHKQSKYVLSILSLCCAIVLSSELFERTIGYENYPHLIYAFSWMWYLIPPLVYLYISSFTKGYKISTIDLLHLLPALLIVYMNQSFYWAPASFKLDYLQQLDQGNAHTTHSINFIIFFIQSALYFILSWLALRKNKNKIKSNQASWLTYLIAGLGTITLLGLLSFLVMNGRLNIETSVGVLYMILVSLFLLLLFIKSIHDPKQLYLIGRPPRLQANLVQEKANEVFHALTQFMKTEEPYRDPTYDVQSLVRQFGHSKNYLTLLIRNETGLNFKDYINSYRVEDAKRKLSSPLSKQYTIQSIASDSGFNSLATFYRVFKKVEGTTPKSFIKHN